MRNTDALAVLLLASLSVASPAVRDPGMWPPGPPGPAGPPGAPQIYGAPGAYSPPGTPTLSESEDESWFGGLWDKASWLLHHPIWESDWWKDLFGDEPSPESSSPTPPNMPAPFAPAEFTDSSGGSYAPGIHPTASTSSARHTSPPSRTSYALKNSPAPGVSPAPNVPSDPDNFSGSVSASASRAFSGSSSSSVPTASLNTSDILAKGPCVNSPAHRGCWSDGYNITTDMYTAWPETGVTRSYSLEITNTTIAPDGVKRMGFLINGKFDGPTLYANWGDYIEVTVTNKMQDNGTSIHFHGMRQWYTGAEDGTPGVTQCPVAPGQTIVYRWQATQYGTAWYHSHFNVQYADGIKGMIIIDGPSTANYDVDLGGLPVTDWYYETASARSYIVAHYFGKPPTTADTGLINGTMVSSEGGQYAVTTISKGKRYKVRLLNVGIDNSFAVSLDNHDFLVIAADVTPIEPFTTHWLFITIGQRYDVIITADQPIGNYWFRAEAQDLPIPNCGENYNNGNIRSIFRYQGAPLRNPTSTPEPYTQTCSDPVIVPYHDHIVPSQKLVDGGTLDSAIEFGVNRVGQTVVKWGLTPTPLYVQWDKPTLEYAWEGNTSFPLAANVLEVTEQGEWIYWIVQEVAGKTLTIDIPHPMHLHGHDFFVLGSGIGDFAATNGTTLNYDNPPRRDTAMLPAGGWLVVAFVVDNPGAWLFHCHIGWHVDEGMGVQFLELESQVDDTAAPAYSFSKVCNSWTNYFPENAAYRRDGDDSGV